jgi:hypothetical protein
MFRALLDHPQEALHKRHLVYCVRIMSIRCGMVAVKLGLGALVWHLFLPQVSVLFMSVIRLLLLQLFELVSLLVVRPGCLYLAVGTCVFVYLLVVLCMNQIQVL